MKNKLLKGSLILLITFNIFNVLNFLYQFSMARLLTVIDYGILTTLYAIFYIIAIFTESIQTIITKYVSPEKEQGKIKNILKRTINKSFKTASILFFIYLIIAIPLSFLLKINYPLMALNGIIIFAFFLVPVTRGIMQGRKMFTSLGINMITESFFKLIFAVLLVLLGWSLFGAVLGPILGASIAFLFSFSPLKNIINSNEKKAETKAIYKYSAPVFIITFTVFVFFALDVIIAKIIFSPESAGFYAIASVLAKIVFIGTQPIAKAMFPLSAENNNKGKDHKKKARKLILSSSLILSIILIIALLVYYFFPDFIIKIFSGKELVESSKILFNLALAFSILSFTYLILQYKLSLGHTKNFALILIFLAIEIMALFIFSSSLIQFSLTYLYTSIIFLIGSLLLLNR